MAADREEPVNDMFTSGALSRTPRSLIYKVIKMLDTETFKSLSAANRLVFSKLRRMKWQKLLLQVHLDIGSAGEKFGDPITGLEPERANGFGQVIVIDENRLGHAILMKKSLPLRHVETLIIQIGSIELQYRHTEWWKQYNESRMEQFGLLLKLIMRRSVNLNQLVICYDTACACVHSLPINIGHFLRQKLVDTKVVLYCNEAPKSMSHTTKMFRHTREFLRHPTMTTLRLRGYPTKAIREAHEQGRIFPPGAYIEVMSLDFRMEPDMDDGHNDSPWEKPYFEGVKSNSLHIVDGQQILSRMSASVLISVRELHLKSTHDRALWQGIRTMWCPLLVTIYFDTCKDEHMLDLNITLSNVYRIHIQTLRNLNTISALIQLHRNLLMVSVESYEHVASTALKFEELHEVEISNLVIELGCLPQYFPKDQLWYSLKNILINTRTLVVDGVDSMTSLVYNCQILSLSQKCPNALSIEIVYEPELEAQCSSILFIEHVHSGTEGRSCFIDLAAARNTAPRALPQDVGCRWAFPPNEQSTFDLSKLAEMIDEEIKAFIDESSDG